VRGVFVVIEEVGVRGREQPRGGLPDMGRNIHPGHDAKAGEIGQHDALGRHGGFDDLFLGGVQCGRTLVRHAKPRMTGRRLARRERGGNAGRARHRLPRDLDARRVRRGTHAARAIVLLRTAGNGGAHDQRGSAHGVENKSEAQVFPKTRSRSTTTTTNHAIEQRPGPVLPGPPQKK
jgi:hypothetical protein